MLTPRNRLITAPNGMGVKIEFTNISTQIELDFVTVYDGAADDAGMLARLSGRPPVPRSYTSSSRFMFITFLPGDYDRSYRTFYGFEGFQARFMSATPAASPQYVLCPETRPCHLNATSNWTLFDDGSGSEPYQSIYFPWWQLEAPAGMQVQIVFTSFDTFFKSFNESFDSVTVYDGPNNSAALLGKITGTPAVPFSYTTTSSYVYIQFRSDKFVNATGFEARYRSVT
eukprot:tig00000093_g3584.t1